MKKYSKKMTILQIFICALMLAASFSSNAQATQYYVSSTSGNNSSSGTSTQPFQTVQKCANVARAGDTCNIGAGTYREQVSLVNSGNSSAPITFTGVPGAIISGTNLVTGWTQYSGNIYVANVGNISPPTQLYVDGQYYNIAHYPVSGYLTATSNSSNFTSIIDSNLTLSSAQIVGATVNTKSDSWSIDTSTATAYANNTITLDDFVTLQMRTKYGFFLSNMFWMMTYPGSWYYNSSTGKIYLWTTSSDNPNNHTVEISSRPSGIVDNAKSYITIQNLAIANADQYDVSINGASNVTLNNLSVSGGQMGIQSYNMTNSLVENNNIQNTVTNGAFLNNSSNDNFLNNSINNAGNVGLPVTLIGSIQVSSGSSNVTISGNTITNSGYDGIWFAGNGINIQNNTIDNSCLVLDDCAGIYTSSSYNKGWRSTISGNTVTNSMGNFSGTAYTYTQAHGIYLDDLSNGYTVSNNKVYNTDYGIYVHSGFNNTITGNKIYGARMYGFFLNEAGSATGEVLGVVHNNVVTGNTFESLATLSTNTNGLGNGVADFWSLWGSPFANFGTFNNNQYCHPNISYAVGTKLLNQVTNYALANWQKATGQDLNSTDTNSSCNPQVTLTLTMPVTGGTITSAPAGINCSSSTCTASFNSGTDVTLTASSGSGSTFTGWSGACSGTGTCSVTMNSAKTVTANFKTQYALTVSTAGNGFGEVFGTGINCGVDASDCNQSMSGGTSTTLTATPASGSTFSGWSGACTGTGACSITMNSNQAVAANFTSSSGFVLTALTTGSGSGVITGAGLSCGNGGILCSVNIPIGWLLGNLTATPASGSVFTGWSGACTGTGTCSVTMSSAKTIIANFSLPTNTLALTQTGTGSGKVTSAPAGINCSGTCSASFNTGTNVTLTASAASGSTFTGWSGACAGTDTCTVTMNSTQNVTANFSPSSGFTLTASATGNGSGVITGAGLNCGNGGTVCSVNIPTGWVVGTITATPASGSIFIGWSGACSGTGTCSVTMNSAQNITANFTSSSGLPLTVSATGSGSGVITGAGLNCGNGSTICSVNIPTGWVVGTLTATPASGSVFTGWSGACTGTGICSVTMNSAQNVTANFTTAYPLTVLTTGTGTGVITGAGLNCGNGGTTCSVNIPTGWVVGTLTATPVSGSVFTGWSGACTGTGTCSVTMNSAQNVTAKFTSG